MIESLVISVVMGNIQSKNKARNGIIIIELGENVCHGRLSNNKKMDIKHWNITEGKLLTQEKEDTVNPHHLIAIVKHS